jgi:hypothetical protein
MSDSENSLRNCWQRIVSERPAMADPKWTEMFETVFMFGAHIALCIILDKDAPDEGLEGVATVLRNMAALYAEVRAYPVDAELRRIEAATIEAGKKEDHEQA